MAQQIHPTKDIKIFVGFGVAVLVALFVLLVIGVFLVADGMVKKQACISRPGQQECVTGTLWDMMRYASEEGGVTITYPDADDQETPGLGEGGSACGGPMRLPCMPGYTCETRQDQDLGICTKTVEATTSRIRGAREGCGAVTGRCSDGLVCKLSPGLEAGVCVEATETSPRVLSLKLKGMQQSQGWYLTEPGTEIMMTVQAVNADAVSAYLTQKGTDTVSARVKLVDLTRGNAGVFTGTFTALEGLLADLDIMARSDDGQESGMSVNVGIVE
ncbi:hypothetical protein KJ781_02460 [Patescibacteria group bacterium]|nr:hypothetical protein [Patescibacteria group bacterium]MBU1448354.1 hypothetical protein [Patescibacteria group bacterium]MBU2613452.1 hypothetical protein [Patescibacteria group bacterium]